MEQIYYTQCPVGYGLGASNGFQIKRLTPGYPTGGDFRHLGLRAFPAGGRTLAPASLRYRRDGDVAEVAALTPRAFEYETERGPWGRPGGLFAHGLRLPVADLAAIRSWPAGLWDSPAWRRSDPEPTRGQPPHAVELGPDALPVAPDFAAVAARLAQGLDPERLAAWLAAVAAAVRDGRTLFLVGAAERLGPTVALLTFAFPEAMRPAATFSTYHDRPEELAGFRIQGTTPAARPNRQALAGLGIVADLDAGTVDPPVDPPAWARTVAHWFARPDPVAEADWSAAAARVRPEAADAEAWSDDWLDHLVGFAAASRSLAVPGSPPAWRELASYADWSARAGAGADWLRRRGPGWWADALGAAGDSADARAALRAHLRVRDAWSDPAAARGWGERFAEAFGPADPADRDAALAEAIRYAPRPARPVFARALLAGVPAAVAADLLDRLRRDPSCDRGMLLPLEAGAAARSIRDGGDPAPLRALVEQARPTPGALAAVLDAAAEVAAGHPDRIAPLARALAPAFDPDAADSGRVALLWALRRDPAEAAAWAGPGLRPALADPDRVATWRAIRDRTPEADRPALARAWLDLAARPGVPDDAFRWGVEELLLPMAPRPDHPRWAETYLARMPSLADLIRRLTNPEFRTLGVPAWIAAARARGEVSAAQANRVDESLGFIRLLRARDPNLLREIRLPDAPAAERGALLQSLAARLDDGSGSALALILDAARVAWPGGFDAGALGLDGLGAALSRSIERNPPLPPPAWLDAVAGLVDRLRPADAGPDWGWEPDGLAAEVAAATVRRPGADPWPTRQHLLRDDRAWRALGVDLRRDLARAGAAGAVDRVEVWDRTLSKPRPERFFELVGNTCDPPSLARVVAARVPDLRSLPAPLPWWDHARHPGGLDDLRDGFARTVPMAPLPADALVPLRDWLKAGVSPEGAARWRCLDGLSVIFREGETGSSRARFVRDWAMLDAGRQPLAGVSADDRHRFAAWVILGLDDPEAVEVAPLAWWLERAGVRDADRLSRWADELAGLAEVGDADRLARAGWVGELRRELVQVLQDVRAKRPGA